MPLVYIFRNSILRVMRQAITQKMDYGCGIACFAFAAKLSYASAAEYLGAVQSESSRFWVKDFVKALNGYGLRYQSKYVKPHIRPLIYQEAAIVLIKRSKYYPAGHYVIRHNGHWMDPWINLPSNKNIREAKSGYRKRLPGNPMYVLLPES